MNLLSRAAASLGIRMYRKLLMHYKSLLDAEGRRRDWVRDRLGEVPAGARMLDAGCGGQQYRPLASHLDYKSQDFGQYTVDVTDGFTSDLGGVEGYKYGAIDYVGDVWNIAEKSDTFDVVLCTEVFEHIPYPTETIAEFSRLLRPGGALFLTLPSNCLRHMDPYFFYSGFSNRYLEKFLSESGFTIKSLETVGDYYSWLALELARTMKNHGIVAKLLLAPAFLWFFNKKATAISKNSLCYGYHVHAVKN